MPDSDAIVKGEIRLSIAIMHAAFDETRRQGLLALLRALAPSQSALADMTHDFAVISDRQKVGPWPVAREAWRWHLTTGATHHLTLQDDVLLCRDFIEGVKEALSYAPDQIVTLFLTKRRGPREAALAGSSWLLTRADVYGQAIVFPNNRLYEFVAWEKATISSDLFHDDTRVTLFGYDTGSGIYATIPSLVQHGGTKMSLLGHNGRYVSENWLGNGSALDIDWSKGLPDPPVEKPSNDVRMLHKRWVKRNV